MLLLKRNIKHFLVRIRQSEGEKNTTNYCSIVTIDVEGIRFLFSHAHHPHFVGNCFSYEDFDLHFFQHRLQQCVWPKTTKALVVGLPSNVGNIVAIPRDVKRLCMEAATPLQTISLPNNRVKQIAHGVRYIFKMFNPGL